MAFLILLAIGLVVCFSLILANEFAKIATAKGYTYNKYFWLCFLFSIAGYLLVIALPDINARVEDKKEFELPEL